MYSEKHAFKKIHKDFQETNIIPDIIVQFRENIKCDSKQNRKCEVPSYTRILKATFKPNSIHLLQESHKCARPPFIRFGQIDIL